MLKRAKKVLIAAAAGLVLITQTAVECTPPMDPVRFGFVKIDGQPAVYIPQCDGDELVSIVVHERYQTGNDVEARLAWSAKGPQSEKARAGFVVLGKAEDFAEVTHPAPPVFPTSLEVEVTTKAGRSFADGDQLSANVPSYTGDTPVAQMEFETQIDLQTHGRRSYPQLRAEYFDAMGNCKIQSPAPK